MPQYYSIFIENKYTTLKILKHLTNNDLIDIGITDADHRRLILQKIKAVTNIKDTSLKTSSRNGNTNYNKNDATSMMKKKNKRIGNESKKTNKNEFDEYSFYGKRRSSLVQLEIYQQQALKSDQSNVELLTGLRKDSNDDDDSELEDLDVESRNRKQSEYIQTLRSDSITKWYILLCFVFVKSAAILNILAISSLEHTMLTKLQLNNAQFALLTSLVFITAAPFTLVVPWIVDKIKVYWTSVIAQTLITIGSIVFVFGCQFVHNINWETGMQYMYVSYMSTYAYAPQPLTHKQHMHSRTVIAIVIVIVIVVAITSSICPETVLYAYIFGFIVFGLFCVFCFRNI